MSLSNHLGNVLTTVSDHKLIDSVGYISYTGPIGGSIVADTTYGRYFRPDLVSVRDYYPYGASMPGRGMDGGGYRFGFQGQETDDEVYGGENAVSYKYRVHDPRAVRFLSRDPLAREYAHNSPYAFSENRVIDKVELEGLESADPPYMDSGDRYRKGRSDMGILRRLTPGKPWDIPDLGTGDKGAEAEWQGRIDAADRNVRVTQRLAEEAIGSVGNPMAGLGTKTVKAVNIFGVATKGFWPKAARWIRDFGRRLRGQLTSRQVAKRVLGEGGSITNSNALAGIGTKSLDDFTPDQGFSGVYDIESGEFLLYPSAKPKQKLVYADGTPIPDNHQVGYNGGYIIVDIWMDQINGIQKGKRVGFALYKGNSGEWVIGFKSGGVNMKHQNF